VTSLRIFNRYQAGLAIFPLILLILITSNGVYINAQLGRNNINSSNAFTDEESVNRTFIGRTPLNLTSLFDMVDQSVVQVSDTSPTSPGSRVGSGFVYDTQGHIITNYHVVAESQGIPETNLENKEFAVSFLDGRAYDARVIGIDKDSEIAVLELENITADNLVPLPLGDSSQLKVGESVVAIGNPFGLSGSMTEGIVSGLGRILPPAPEGDLMVQPQNIQSFLIPNIIQTDAAINPGNSGGPLLDTDGEVIGVNTAIFSNTGVYAGVGFAIPSNIIKKVVPELISTGEYRHPYIGIVGVDVSPEIASIMKLNESRGFLVTDVTAGSPAEKSGIRGGDILTNVDGTQIELGGDVIIAVDNVTVRKIDDLLSYLEAEQSVGENIVLRIIRDGKIQDVEMTLAARPTPQQQQQIQQRQQEGPSLGINAVNLTSQIAERMNLTKHQQYFEKEGGIGGVLVVDVLSGGPAEKAGIRGGYIITSINGSQLELGGDVIVGIDNTTIATVDALKSYIDTKKIGDIVQATVIRDNQELRLPVTLGSTSELSMFQPNNSSSPYSQPPTGPTSDFFNQMYNLCVETFGANVCNPLFKR
jgi:S1-C subfamily serine protease